MRRVNASLVTFGTVGLLLFSASACGAVVGADFEGWSVGARAAGRADGGATSDESVPEPVEPNADGSCPADRKNCNGQCVALVDPNYGCAASTCTPCSIPKATAACNSGVCVVRACDVGRGDCNGRPDDGCETDVTSDHGHCGVCETACTADTVCNKAACSASCDQGTTNCNGSCFELASNAEHCGSCANACPVPANGVATCQQSVCSFTCNPGFVVDGAACKTGPRLLLLGGMDDNDYRYDMWEWNGANWTMIYPSTGYIQGPLVILDGKVVVAAGDEDDDLVTLYAWNGAGWDVRNTSGRPSWQGTPIVNNNGTLVRYGGQLGNTYSDETWTMTGTTWTQRNIAGPPARSEFAMTAVNGKVVVFGGGDRSVLGATLITSLGDTWEYNGTKWTKRNVTGPDPRYQASMAALGNKAVLFGGAVYGPNQGETWEWDGSTWANRNIPGPPPRRRPAMTSFMGKVVLYGGYDVDNQKTLSDFWEYDGNTWTQITVTGPSPGPRAWYHTMIEVD